MIELIEYGHDGLIFNVIEPMLITNPILNDNIYLIKNYYNRNTGSMCLISSVLDNDKFIMDDEVADPIIILERNVNIDPLPMECGTYLKYILYDYSRFAFINQRARIIQNRWKHYLKVKRSIYIIQKAWKKWKYRKDFIWNPYTFVGIAHLIVEYIQLNKQ